MMEQMFCKEVVTWKSLRHPNVLPLLGVTMNKKHFAMVSEWMVNGDINKFVKAHRDVNRFELVELHSYCWPYLSLTELFWAARGHRTWIDVYAQRRGNTW